MLERSALKLNSGSFDHMTEPYFALCHPSSRRRGQRSLGEQNIPYPAVNFVCEAILVAASSGELLASKWTLVCSRWTALFRRYLLTSFEQPPRTIQTTLRLDNGQQQS